jgi:hypothetical protein
MARSNPGWFSGVEKEYWYCRLSPIMRLPNFVVIGAPKCGTTSLYYYLRQHPDIYLPERKELHYFSHDCLRERMAGPGDRHALSSLCSSRQQYEEHYAKARDQKAVGDISPSYFYFSEVSERIKHELGDPKIILMVRDPIQKAFSQYMHLVRDNRENLGFYDALMAEEQRIRANWAVLWRYAESSLYTDKLRKYLSVFGTSRLKVILFEELSRSPQAILRDLFGFLGVDVDFQPTISRIYNRSGRPKSKWMADFLNKPNFVTVTAAKLVPEKIRTPLRLAFLEMNTGKKERIDERSRAYLTEYSRRDVVGLERLLDRKLGWGHKDSATKKAG